MAKKSKFDEKWSKIYFLTFFWAKFSRSVVAFAFAAFVAMAYGELVQIERESFLTSAAILDCVALVEVFCRFLS